MSKDGENMLTLAGFCQAVGASDTTVGRWVKLGLPCQRVARPGGGRPQLYFDPEEAKGWVALHGSQTQRRRALALTGSSAVAVTVSPAAEDTKSEADGEAGLLPALGRLQRQELETHRLLMKMKVDGNVAAILALQDMHLAEIRALAQTESAAIDFRTRIGELVVKTDIMAKYLRVVGGVRNAVLGVASSCVSMIMPYLRDQNDAFAVQQIIDRMIREALRGFAEQERAEARARSGKT